MKTYISILIILLINIQLIAQDTASIKIIVLNESNEVIEGEQIFFEAKDKSYKTKGFTNEEGFFFADLIGGKTYDIQIKTVGDAQDYNTIKIPALEEGQSYSGNVLTITIFESKTFTLNNVYFDSGKSTLKTSSFTELNELLEYLTLKKSIKIEIYGHTDNVGNDEINMTLSENRSKAVKKYLVGKGISSDRLSIKAYGETKPVATNETEEGRQLNRRIEILVL